MATSTTNLGLTKPAGTDKIRIAQINGNMDIIDEKMGAVGSTAVQTQINNLQDGLAIVANNNTHAAIAAGQFVYVKNHGTLAEGLYTANSAIAQDGTLSSSNLTADASGGLNALNDQMANKVELQYKTVTGTTSATYGYIDLELSSSSYEVLALRCTDTPCIPYAGSSGRWFAIPMGTTNGDDYMHVSKGISVSIEVVYCAIRSH